MARLILSFLGPFQVTLDGRAVTGFESNKVRALLAYLAVESDRLHARESLAALLWPNFLNQSAVHNLRSALAKLRHIIDDDDADPSYLHITRNTVQFNPAADYVLDVDTFTAAAASPLEKADVLLRAYRGDFLDGFSLPDNEAFEEWLQAQRECLRRQMLESLGVLADHALEQVDYEKATTYARQQLAMDDLRESAYRQLMSALALSRRRAEALVQYEVCVRVLRDELAVEPSADTRALAERIDAEADNFVAPPVEWRPPIRHNLPAQLSSFVGREREVGEVRQLLAAARLVTLTGAGGCGKTRLSLVVAGARLADYPNGVWWVGLAPLESPDLLPETVANTIGLRDLSGRPMQEALVDYLRPRNALLVLDNCEHLIDACAALAETLLQGCPNLRILATSRETLAIPGETLFVVPSLEMPARDHTPLAELALVESVRLFVERAAAVRLGYELTEENAAAVTEICRRLDGIPLAIELAAARIQVLSAGQIAERLDNRFGLLTGGGRNAMPRQQTLRAAIEWSYTLLSEPERRLFARLAVFRGGWTLEAAEAVCADPDLSVSGNLTGLEVLDLLSQLVSKSIVRAREIDGAIRYSRLETIRQYGNEKLAESGELEQMRRRHLEYFLEFAEQGDRESRGPGSLEWKRRMDAEHDNLRVAMEYAFDVEGASDAVVRLSRALVGYNGVWSTGSFVEGHYWIDKALSLPDALPPTALRARLLYHSAVFDGNGVWETQRSRFEESLAIFEGLGEAYRVECAHVLMWLGFKLCYQIGERERGTRYVQEAIRIFEDSGEKWGLGFTLNLYSGVIIELDNDFNAAWAVSERGMEVARQLGEQFLIAVFNDNFGYFNIRYGLYHEGRAYLDKALDIHRQFRTFVFACQDLKWRGDGARGLNDYDKAEADYRESLAMVQDVGWSVYQPNVSLALGFTLLHQGEVGEAVACFMEALELAKRYHLRFAPMFVLDGLAAVCVAQGKTETAARSFGAFEEQIEGLFAEGYTRHRLFDAIDLLEHERYESRCRSALSEAEFDALFAEGRSLTLDASIDYALREVGQLSFASPSLISPSFKSRVDVSASVA